MPLRIADATVAAAPTNSFAAIHAAALANLQGAAPPPAPSPLPMHVATPAGSPGWPEEVGDRVSWMVGQTESHAELTLTPPQLGKGRFDHRQRRPDQRPVSWRRRPPPVN
ncbi:MAG: hypothetical protein IPJ73_05015 [Zoogloea sp.]|nr:hypothetical protein [Zoogloea sp.]